MLANVLTESSPFSGGKTQLPFFTSIKTVDMSDKTIDDTKKTVDRNINFIDTKNKLVVYTTKYYVYVCVFPRVSVLLQLTESYYARTSHLFVIH